MSQISNFIKILPVEAEMIHDDRRTDMTRLKGVFRDYVKTAN
jgi:hypothetical protein